MARCPPQPGCVLCLRHAWPRPQSHVAAASPTAGTAEPGEPHGATHRALCPHPGVLPQPCSGSRSPSRTPPCLCHARALNLLQQSRLINHPVIARLSQGKSKKPQACTGVPKESNQFVKLSAVQWGSFCSSPPQTLSIAAVPAMM